MTFRKNKITLPQSHNRISQSIPDRNIQIDIRKTSGVDAFDLHKDAGIHGGEFTENPKLAAVEIADQQVAVYIPDSIHNPPVVSLEIRQKLEASGDGLKNHEPLPVGNQQFPGTENRDTFRLNQDISSRFIEEIPRKIKAEHPPLTGIGDKDLPVMHDYT